MNEENNYDSSLRQPAARTIKPFYKRWWFWILIAILVVGLAIIGFNVCKNHKFTKGLGDKFITSSPIDLTQIYGISPFRSCMGHDYSALNVNGELEDKRSMKHYVQPLSEFDGTSNKVKLYAPFDGKVARIDGSKEGLKDVDKRMGGMGLDIYPLFSNMWTMEFGHVYPLESLKVGSKFKAGDLIGYAYVQDTGSSFDLALWTDNKFSRSFNGEDNTATLDSIFNHMTDSVLAQFTKYTSKNSLIIAKEYRDSNLCQEVDRGTNARGEKEVVFASDDQGDTALQTIINPDPFFNKNKDKKDKNTDFSSSTDITLEMPIHGAVADVTGIGIYCTSGENGCPNNGAHEGIDLKVGKATTIYAAAPGKVIKNEEWENIKQPGVWQVNIEIQYGDQYFVSYGFEYMKAGKELLEKQKELINVKLNDTVKTGDAIGTLQYLGDPQTHLHFGIRKKETSVCPILSTDAQSQVDSIIKKYHPSWKMCY